MSDRLTDLQSKLSADERFLDHRDLHELCRLQQAEIERLRTERFDLVPVDTVETIACSHWPSGETRRRWHLLLLPGTMRSRGYGKNATRPARRHAIYGTPY